MKLVQLVKRKFVHLNLAYSSQMAAPTIGAARTTAETATKMCHAMRCVPLCPCTFVPLYLHALPSSCLSTCVPLHLGALASRCLCTFALFQLCTFAPLCFCTIVLYQPITNYLYVNTILNYIFTSNIYTH